MLKVEYNTDQVPIKLPLLECLKNIYKVKKSQPLRGYRLLGVQHIQGTSIPLIDSISEAGIKYEDIFLVGKAYSIHPLAADFLLKKGCHFNPQFQMRNYENPYEEEIEFDIRDTLRKIMSVTEKNKPILIIDEGGKAVRIIHEEYPEYLHLFKCVEQTTRGIKEVSKIGLSCPVINVARSQAKKTVEGPLIAESMLYSLDLLLAKNNELFELKDRKCLIIGYGVIGSIIAEELTKRGYSISIYDSNVCASNKAREKGFRTISVLDPEMEEVSLILGCTGNSDFDVEHISNLKNGVLLVNCASSDLEFSSWKIRRNGTITASRMAPEQPPDLYRPWNNLYKASFHNKTIFLANGGFPINFNGTLDPISPENFQLTRALIYAGLLQVIQTNSVGVIDLDREAEQLILENYARLIEL